MKKILSAAVRRLRFYRAAMRSPFISSLSLSELLQVLRGFNPESVRLFELNKENRGSYLRDIDKKRISPNTNKDFSNIFNNKIEFQYFFEKIFNVPTLHSIIWHGTPLRGSPNYPGATPEEALSRGIRLVIKPVFGGMSRGIHFVHREGEETIVNDQPMDSETFARFIAGLHQFLVCEQVVQHPDLSRIYPNAVNTVRMVTVRDPDDDQLRIPLAIQNFGTKGSTPTDNFSRGGVSARIDVESGVYGPGVMRGPGWERITCSEHPDTGERITGRRAPNWVHVRDALLDTLADYPFFDYVGWDVVITKDGFYVLEGNHNPGNFVTQAHQPLLAHPLTRRFYAVKGVVRGA